MLYKVHTKQALPISRQEAWDFLSDPRNLERITPKDMGFKITSGGDKAMYPGQIIQYKVNPFPGFTTNWVTEIKQVDHLNFFIDSQLFGPYKLWHHEHFIHKIEGGVMMEDLVHYKLPLGFLGKMVHPYLVKPRLDEIFETRRKKMIELFGTIS
ncbi:SRPBCC family protein [Psychroflexus halocasei]|uniref:Ligand-binding SRPBCC domain-containing protein n=1 Tax=Psychroflexus halocasei TaxID=908615 RepID=A0A1H3YJB9_9FLAO|nr:SRPBCC family protein [Psychroflexus halocasei]SEA11032.1 Ligand-binding SRPBCC domain-containing protein [Psychroflexus halocasei]